MRVFEKVFWQISEGLGGRPRTRGARGGERRHVDRRHACACVHTRNVRASKSGVPRAPWKERVGNVAARTALSFPSYSSANWSMRGAIIRQGPHQGAQKSTRTGMSLFSTSASKEASVTTVAAPISGVEGSAAVRRADGTEREKDADAIAVKIAASVRARDASEIRAGHPTRDAAMAAKPGRDSKRTVSVGDLGLAHEARAGGSAGGRTRAELHAGFAREGNLRAEGSHVGGDGGHDVGVWANVSSSDRRVARCVRVTNLRARQGRRRLWRTQPGRASTRHAGEVDGLSGRILQLDKMRFRHCVSV